MDPNRPSKTESAGDGASTTPVTPLSPTTTEASEAPPSRAAAEVAADLEKAPGGPGAGSEPAAQVASASAHRVSPPLPASYEMPDDYADESWFDKTKAWVEENPALAVLAATGIGLVVGRLVMGLTPDPEPPSLADRIEQRARVLAKESKKTGRRAVKQARGVAHGTSDSVSDGLHRAAEALRDVAGSVADRAEYGAERTKDAAETAVDALKVALAGVAAKAVDEWASRTK